MLEFAKSQPWTLGVEVELQIVDRSTHELTAKAPQILSRWSGPATVQPEIFQSMLEISTGICADAAAAEADLRATATRLMPIARDLGVRFISTGTHPTARYQERQLFPAERYHGLIARNQWIARRLLIFGLHVHVGMPDPETCIAVQNELLYDLGLLLAVSTSSPYWQGEVTGLASSRVTVFEAMPTGGIPQLVHDWAEFNELVETLQRANAITSMKDLWWDIRPSPRYGTLEIRVCDGLATIRETCAIVALVQALARRAGARVAAGTARTFPPAWRVRENKWRASRHGMDADYIISNEGHSLPIREHLLRTLDDLVANGFMEESQYLDDLRRLGQGAPTSADRQRALFERTGSFDAVTRALADEFEDDVLANVAAR
ncbi:MAG TPA: YbdK family carboxylate-amine ligase [Gemmatimonadaceae bacterium]|jgi:carboxylate-amine ligase|nr:YbdK family carboxylate-amine ligase [Gemmatimonadaceae bacterium]